MGTRLAAWRNPLSAMVPLVLFVAAVVALHRLGGEFHLGDVLAEFRAIEPWRVAVAIVLAASSYLVLTGYEKLALLYVGSGMPWRAYGLTAFVANAVGHNLGVAAISGGAVRYRMYSQLGLSAGDIAQVVAFCTVTFMIGAGTLVGASLVINAGEAATRLHASAGLARMIGVLMLAAVLSYVAWCAFARTPLAWRGWESPVPSVRLATGQIAVACIDLLLTSACLFILLPDSAGVSFLAFAGLFMVALAASVASSVPGGLGVFESIMVLLLPSVPAPQMLGVLLAYRLVYYLLPFGLALMLVSAHEADQHRERLATVRSWARKSLGLVVPQAIALLVFGAGFLLLLSGATPAVESRLAMLDRFVPLSLLELSHLVGSAVGVLLLILARGLFHRLDAAWHVTMWLLGAGIAASLLKGLDYEEALLLAVVLIPLWSTRTQFYRTASLLAEPSSPAWLASPPWRSARRSGSGCWPTATYRTRVSCGGSSRSTVMRRACFVRACWPYCCSVRSPGCA